MTEKKHFEVEEERERREVRQMPEAEEEEIYEIFDTYGIARSAVTPMVTHLKGNEDMWVKVSVPFVLSSYCQTFFGKDGHAWWILGGFPYHHRFHRFTVPPQLHFSHPSPLIITTSIQVPHVMLHSANQIVLITVVHHSSNQIVLITVPVHDGLRTPPRMPIILPSLD